MRNVILNSVFFLNADPNDPTTIHQFSFARQAWRKIQTGGVVKPNMENVKAIMDYDTLVIYAFTDGRVSTFPIPVFQHQTCKKGEFW
jgi:hypothetical protein